MADKHQPTWEDRGDGAVWISHDKVKPSDLPRLSAVRNLTVWNVRFPDGLLAQLPNLEFLDIRGGSRADLALLDGCQRLRGLVVNQVRGLSDAGSVSTLDGLEILSFYGLAKLQALPPMRRLTRLRRLELGQLRGLTDWSSVLELVSLEELLFKNKLVPDRAVIDRLAHYSPLRYFDWWGPDEPQSTLKYVRESLGRERPPRTLRPETWFADYG